MLALISPAKKLDFETEWHISDVDQPDLLSHSQELVNEIQSLAPNQLQTLMKLSDQLAELNFQRFQSFSVPFTSDNARPASLAFRGDTYVGLDADTLSSDDLLYANDHLRILSGLYGLLRPNDLVQAYRLEMGTKLATVRGKNLYEFWGEIITHACNQVVAEHRDKTIVSLASNEYIKAVRPKHLTGPFLSCEFYQVKDNQLKNIGLFSKRARGMMARFMIQNRVDTPDQLSNFNDGGYEFQRALSNDEKFVFTRTNTT